MIKISLIIPNYNRAAYLQEALQSIKVQTYEKWEVIVVDDGSTDTSKEVVAALSKNDNRIKWIERQESPKGAANCRNIGIEKSQGEFIIFLDSDDLLAPHCLEQRLSVMIEHPNLDFAVFKMQYFSENPGDDTRLWNLHTKEDVLSRFLKLDTVWQTSGPIWRKSALKKIGGFNVKLKCWQDIDIHLKTLFANLNFKICYDLKVDCYYRKNSTDSISQTNTNSKKKLKSKAKVFLWAKPRADALRKECSQMVLHILISALNSHNIKFYLGFYNHVKNELNTSEKRNLLAMATIISLKLYKLSYFKTKFIELKTKMISENSIGKYHV